MREEFYIVRIDAAPSTAVPGGSFVTVESGPHQGLAQALHSLQHPKPRSHVLPDIVWLPCEAPVWAMNEPVGLKPRMVVTAETVQQARETKGGRGLVPVLMHRRQPGAARREASGEHTGGRQREPEEEGPVPPPAKRHQPGPQSILMTPPQRGLQPRLQRFAPLSPAGEAAQRPGQQQAAQQRDQRQQGQGEDLQAPVLQPAGQPFPPQTLAFAAPAAELQGALPSALSLLEPLEADSFQAAQATELAAAAAAPAPARDPASSSARPLPEGTRLQRVPQRERQQKKQQQQQQQQQQGQQQPGDAPPLLIQEVASKGRGALGQAASAGPPSAGQASQPAGPSESSPSEPGPATEVEPTAAGGLASEAAAAAAAAAAAELGATPVATDMDPVAVLPERSGQWEAAAADSVQGRGGSKPDGSKAGSPC